MPGLMLAGDYPCLRVRWHFLPRAVEPVGAPTSCTVVAKDALPALQKRSTKVQSLGSEQPASFHQDADFGMLQSYCDMWWTVAGDYRADMLVCSEAVTVG